MDNHKRLVIYYSLEGSTRLVAEAIAEATGADLAVLKPVVEPSATGFSRYLLYGWQRITHPRMRIAPLEVDPQAYDLLYIGTPVWNAQPTPAVQTLLRITQMTGRHLGLFCTHRGGPGETLALMERAATGATIVGRIELANVQSDPTAACERARAWARGIAATRISRMDADTQ